MGYLIVHYIYIPYYTIVGSMFFSIIPYITLVGLKKWTGIFEYSTMYSSHFRVLKDHMAVSENGGTPI